MRHRFMVDYPQKTILKQIRRTIVGSFFRLPQFYISGDAKCCAIMA